MHNRLLPVDAKTQTTEVSNSSNVVDSVCMTSGFVVAKLQYVMNHEPL